MTTTGHEPGPAGVCNVTEQLPSGVVTVTDTVGMPSVLPAVLVLVFTLEQDGGGDAAILINQRGFFTGTAQRPTLLP
jgi:hypothetical protein